MGEAPTKLVDDTGTDAKWRYGLYAVAMGLIAIIATLAVAVVAFDSTQDVTTVIATIVSPITAIVSAYFGIQVGSAGKAQADKSAAQANTRAIALALAADNDTGRANLREFGG